jgi:hypothetical protein
MSKQLICGTCGTIGKPRTETRGSIFIEIILWLCFLVPGLIYSIWRLTTRRPVCRECRGHQLMPLTTPAGRALADKFSASAGR